MATSTSFPKPMSPTKRPWGWILFALVIVLSIIAAGIYLFDNWSELTATGESTTVDGEIAALHPNEVRDILLRDGYISNGSAAEVLYAPNWYFDWNDRELPITDQPAMAFFIMEEIHDGVLDVGLPQTLLQIGDQQYEPLETVIVSDAPHHRVSRVIFSAVDDEGDYLITENSEEITLISPIDGKVSGGNTYQWELPLPYGLGLLNTGESELPINRSALTFAGFLAIMGGMLSALSPCLLQLAVYYAAVLASSGAEAGATPQTVATARAHVIKTSLYFVGGFTVIYTAGGVIAGYVGQSLESLDALNGWYRPVSIVSGVVIILLAFRVALQSRAPLVCRLPIRVNSGTGFWGSTLMGLSFAVGCTSCFSATVLSALLIYVGSTGSPIIGGLVLFLFSAGVGAIFLLAAWILGEATPEFGNRLHKAQPVIGGLSALVMVLFGVLMITYQFHIVSGYLLRVFEG